MYIGSVYVKAFARDFFTAYCMMHINVQKMLPRNFLGMINWNWRVLTFFTCCASYARVTRKKSGSFTQYGMYLWPYCLIVRDVKHPSTIISIHMYCLFDVCTSVHSVCKSLCTLFLMISSLLKHNMYAHPLKRRMWRMYAFLHVITSRLSVCTLIALKYGFLHIILLLI